MGLALILLFVFVPESLARLGLVAAIAIAVHASFLSRTRRVPVVSTLLDLMERDKHRKMFPGRGAILLLAGALLASLFFPPFLVILGLVVLVVGDPLAHLHGKRYGRIPLPWDRVRALESRVLAAVVCGLLLFTITSVLGAEFFSIWSCMLAATVGMFVESLPLSKIGLDDNLVVPSATALVFYLLV